MVLLDHKCHLPSSLVPLTIIPFGCVHADDPGFREHLFDQCIDEIKSTPHCIAIGLGDYKNLFRTHARMHLKAYTTDEDSWRELDVLIRGEARKFVTTYLKPIQSKLLGLAEGNHFYKFQDGTTDTQFMCQLLEVPYLEKPAFVRLSVNIGKDQGDYTLKLLIHHGDWSAGYTRPGGDLNSVEMKAMGFDLDVYIFSHTHRKMAFQSPSISIPSRGRLHTIEKPRVFIRTGCFVTAYDGCTSTYAQKKLLNPTELGYVVLQTKWTRHRDKEEYARLKKEGKSYKERVDGAKENLRVHFSVRV